MEPQQPASPDRLRLPGPRALWWVVGLLPLVLGAGAIVYSALNTEPSQEIQLEVRYRTLLWRAGEYFGASPEVSRKPDRLGQADRSKRAPPAVPLPSAATVGAAATPDTGLVRQLRAESQRAAAGSLRELFKEALAARPVASKARRGAASRPRPPQADAELVIAHAIATQNDDLATEFAARLASPSHDLRAALAAVPEPAPATATAGTRLALPTAEALRASRARSFGNDWSAYTRLRIRARLHATAGDFDAARELNRQVREQDARIVPFLLALAYLIALAGLAGLGLLLFTAARTHAARLRGELPFAWLRKKYSGLPDDGPYRRDPLGLLLGSSAWLAGYLAFGLLAAALPGPRLPYGLATLGQTFAGILLAQAVILGLAREPPALHSAARLGGPEAAPFWKSSTAALRAYCVLLPVMLVVALVNAMIFEGGSPHPVVGFLLEEPDPLQLATLAMAAVIAAPVGEELLFRGFLYRAIRQRHGYRRALFVTAMLFAVIHGSPQAFIPYAVLGLSFGLVFEWVGSLWAPIILHGLWNFVVLSYGMAAALS